MTGKQEKFCGIVFFLVFWAGILSGKSLPEGIYAKVFTNRGMIELALEYEKVPLTVANFIGLSEGTILHDFTQTRKRFFDGSVFHRVVPGHVIQAGRWQNSQQEGPGYEIPNEIDPSLRHDRAGILGMANSGPHTNGCQFYITLAERSYLDTNYTVFGHVVKGMDVVANIRQGDVIQKIAIVRIGKKARAFKCAEASFRTLLEKKQAEVQRIAAEKKQEERRKIRESWPNLEPLIQSEILKVGTGELVGDGISASVRYRGLRMDGREFGNDGEGNPTEEEQTESFSFQTGVTHINPGLDAIIPLMRDGEIRRIVLCPEIAYGRQRGFYGKNQPGKKRFVISPDTTLNYVIEILSSQPRPEK